jgi:F0F1-type ATP synthase alpha subunit
VGRISSIGDGIATIYGLDGVKAGELIEFVGRSGCWLKVKFGKLDVYGMAGAEGDLARRTKIFFRTQLVYS